MPTKPSPETYFAYFKRYVDQVPEEDLATAFSNQLPIIKDFLNAITEEKSTYAYAPGKWTLKELLQHITDTERIFNYRALAIARKEAAPLPGFDEDSYAQFLYESFTNDMFASAGIASNNPLTVASLGFTTLGHFYHHKKVMEERYLS